MLGVKSTVNHAYDYTFAGVGLFEWFCTRMRFVKAEYCAAPVDTHRVDIIHRFKFAVEPDADNPFGSGDFFSFPGFYGQHHDRAFYLAYFRPGGTQAVDGG